MKMYGKLVVNIKNVKKIKIKTKTKKNNNKKRIQGCSRKCRNK